MKVFLVRHADAGRRGSWAGDDRARPLTPRGRRQAAAIAELIEPAAPGRIVSSPAVRCTETVATLADRLGLPIETDEALWEGADVQRALGVLKELGHVTAVLCTHGDVIPELLHELRLGGMTVEGELRWEKGSTWLLEGAGTEPDTGAYLPPAP